MQLHSLSNHLRNLRLSACLTLGLCAASAVWSKPSIQSIGVNPNPLMIGRDFTVTVAASPDVTQATAVLNARKGQPQLLSVPLTKQGSNWVGTAAVPIDLTFDAPHKPEANLKVLVLDAALRGVDATVRVPVVVPDISAVFTNGILTVTCDNQDNTVIIAPNATGMLLVNNGAIPITGGFPTMTNTTLIRVLGLDGDDIIEIVGVNGMPPSHLLGGNGNDKLTGSNSADELDGGSGDDTLLARAGVDILSGGPGNDFLVGGFGEDQVSGGPGEDQFQWNPGDSNDVIEGQEDEDTLVFNGSNIGEIIDLSADNGRFRFVRNVASINLDCGGIERVVFHALGGADQVVVNDLAGTEVAHVIVDLVAFTGLGDEQADVVAVNGTATNDVLKVHGSTNGMLAVMSSADVTVLGAEVDRDQLRINGLGGADEIDASAVEPGAMPLLLDGGLGIDVLFGGQGNDTIVGGRDNDVLFGGPGDDIFPWNPGDGLDVIEGQSGVDTLLFNGANVSEVINISANGSRVTFTRNVANISLDCHEVEKIQFNATGGADQITVNDLSGTGVTEVNLSLFSPIGSTTTDNSADMILVHGNPGDDAVIITGAAGAMSIHGLSATVNIVGCEPGLDIFHLLLQGGDDVADATGLAADVINLILTGGLGADVLLGSAGADILLGDEGDDILIGGPGLDSIDGGTGNNILIQD